MSDLNWEKVETIIDQALDLPEEERKTFIDNQCGENQQLKSEVTLLLEAIFDSEGWLEDPRDFKQEFYKGISDDADLLSTSEPLIGKQVGAYVIREKIGEGGMGTVYRAERSDGEFDHQVAIKIIRHGQATDKNIRRFHREQRILAGLNHPGIAKLFDGGITDEGFPYIIMEHISGIPIDDYCKTNNCGIDKKIAIFEQVLEAIRYAHENLVVHRDLKPGNILVDEEGNVKILDFGISKLLEDENDTALTHTGDRLLTPRYAAPEQIRQENITTATDLYALGVIFYQLLAGTLPFKLEELSKYEMEQAILEEEASKPSSKIDDPEVQNILKNDLDAITLKAIRKEPEQRYHVANEFLNDLRHYQNGLPVSAREDSFKYRSQKFLKRHKHALALAAGILVFFFGLVGFYTWQIAQERDNARREAEKAEEVTNFLIGIFEANDPKYNKGDTLSAKQLLETGKNKINGLDNQPAVKARMLKVLGNIHGLLSRPKQADSLLKASLAIKKNIYGSSDPELASGYYALASVKNLLGKYRQSQALLDTAITYQNQIYGPQSKIVGKSLELLAESLRKNGELDSARSTISKAHTIYKVQGDTLSKEYLDVVMELGAIYQANGMMKEAEQVWRASLQLSRELFEPPHPIIINNINGLAYVLKEAQYFTEAESLYIESMNMTNDLYGEMHVNAATTLNNLAGLYYYTRKYEKADSLYSDSYTILKEVLGEAHPSTISTLYNIANLKLDLGEYTNAEKIYKRVIKLDISNFGENHPNVASDYYALAILYKKQRKYQQAISIFYKSLGIRRTVYDNPHHPYIGLVLNSIAKTLTKTGNYPKAEKLFNEALICFVDTYGKDHKTVSSTAGSYAHLMELQNKKISADSLISIAHQSLKK